MIFDILFLILFCWAAYKGYTRGFILQAATLAALILGIFGAVGFSDAVANIFINRFGFSDQYMDIIAFAVTFIVIVIAIHLLARLFESLLKAVNLNFVNRIFGILFNLLKYSLIISGILVILNGVNRRVNFMPQEKINESYLYRPLSVLAPTLFPYLRFDSRSPENQPSASSDKIVV